MNKNKLYFFASLLIVVLIPIFAVAQEAVTDSLAALPDSLAADSMVDKHGRPYYVFHGWLSGVWLWLIVSIVMAVIALAVRFLFVRTRHTFNGNGLIILLAIIGGVVNVFLTPNREMDYAPIWMITLVVCYVLVAFVPDPLGVKSKDGFLTRMVGVLGKLPAFITLIIVIVLLTIAFVAGQAVFWAIPFFTLFKFCGNMIESVKVKIALKRGDYNYVEEISAEEVSE